LRRYAHNSLGPIVSTASLHVNIL